MSTFWKVMLGLLITVPLGAYITGTLVASQAHMPAERPAVVVTDTSTDNAVPSNRPSPSESTSPEDGTDPSRAPDDDDGHDDDNGGRGHGDGDDVQVVRPTPRAVDDDHGGDDDGGGDGTDDSEGADDD